MFVRRLKVERLTASGQAFPCPIAHIDNFCMRNFTNDAAFDDTLPLADGLLEAGNLVPLAQFQISMQAWFRRKNYLAPQEVVRITELHQQPARP